MRNHNVTSPVIVPTVALQADLWRRAQGCTDERLVIVTPKLVCTIGFRELLTKLHQANQYQLGKLFVDEAHCYSTEIDYMYRPCFGLLPTLGEYPVPLVLTTATVPEWIVSDILSNFFGSNRTPSLVRQDTNRLNISYSVKAYRIALQYCVYIYKANFHSYMKCFLPINAQNRNY